MTKPPVRHVELAPVIEPTALSARGKEVVAALLALSRVFVGLATHPPARSLADVPSSPSRRC